MNEFTEKLRQLNQPVDIKDIDFRVQSVTKSGFAVILAYKDARYDMTMLDKVIGPDNWARDHKVINGRLYCGIGIRRPAELNKGSGGAVVSPSEWVWKWDVGVESNTEKEKGQASDSFKRAGFNWGIGRELYDFPFICIKLDKDEFYVDNGRAKATNKFKLKEFNWAIERKDGKIIKLTASYAGIQRYNFSANPPKPTSKSKSKPKSDSESKVIPKELKEAIAKLNECKTIPELEKIWGEYPVYHSHKEFLGCAKITKASIKGKSK